MKNPILVIAFTFLAFTTNILAQQHSLKLAPLDAVTGRLTATYELSVAQRTSVLVNVQAINSNRNTNIGQSLLSPAFLLLAGNTNTKTKGGSIELAVRQYLISDSKLEGLYVQGGVMLGSYTINQTRTPALLLAIFGAKETIQSEDVFLRTPTIRIGYQLITKGGFTLDTGFGARANAMLFNCRIGYSF